MASFFASLLSSGRNKSTEATPPTAATATVVPAADPSVPSSSSNTTTTLIHTLHDLEPGSEAHTARLAEESRAEDEHGPGHQSDVALTVSGPLKQIQLASSDQRESESPPPLTNTPGPISTTPQPTLPNSACSSRRGSATTHLAIVTTNHAPVIAVESSSSTTTGVTPVPGESSLISSTTTTPAVPVEPSSSSSSSSTAVPGAPSSTGLVSPTSASSSSALSPTDAALSRGRLLSRASPRSPAVAGRRSITPPPEYTPSPTSLMRARSKSVVSLPSQLEQQQRWLARKQVKYQNQSLFAKRNCCF